MLFLALLVVFTSVLVIGSLVEINVQSSGFRTSTDEGYGALASRVVEASNQTGGQLAGLMESAPQLTNRTVQVPNKAIPPYLNMARTELQQGLDQAVSSATGEANQATNLVPPPPSDRVGDQFTQVMSNRAMAVTDIRTAIDRMLGMTPLLIAGAPSSSALSSAAPLTSPDQAGSALTAAGVLLQQADNAYRTVIAEVHRARIPIRLPVSAWVPAPVDAAPLAPGRLGATATLLAASGPLAPFHQLIFSAVGLSPPAVPSPSSGSSVVGDGCLQDATHQGPVSAVPGPAPTVLPPTLSVTVLATVTNCGTVVESGVAVSETLALADPPGTALPAANAQGGTSKIAVGLRSGSSTALSFNSLAVAGGHLYTLKLAIAIPVGQTLSNGSTQQFLLRISQ
jgi:hypothetical protein